MHQCDTDDPTTFVPGMGYVLVIATTNVEAGDTLGPSLRLSLALIVVVLAIEYALTLIDQCAISRELWVT